MWIEAKVCRIFPVRVLISCKRLNVRLDEQDIDAFWGELQSSGANKGVLYSFGGFTRPALEKAQALDICCCKLYKNQPPDLPESLVLKFYCCTPKFRIRLGELPDEIWGFTTFNDLFSFRLSSETSPTVLDHLSEIYCKGEKAAIEVATKSREFPQSWSSGIEISTIHEGAPLFLSVLVEGAWEVYRGKLEAHLLDGSYSFTSGEFQGSQMSPWVDLRGPHPGPAWELVEDPPVKIEPGVGIFILEGGDFRQKAIEYYGPNASR